MKQSANKSAALSLAPPPASQSNSQIQEKSTLIESFEGWLNSVAPKLLESTLKVKSGDIYQGRRSLTSNEMISLNRATVRESTKHRHWPPDVVVSFLQADVIKRKKTMSEPE